MGPTPRLSSSYLVQVKLMEMKLSASEMDAAFLKIDPNPLHKSNRGKEVKEASKTSAQLRDAWLGQFKAPVVRVFLSASSATTTTTMSTKSKSKPPLPLKTSAERVNLKRRGYAIENVKIVAGKRELEEIFREKLTTFFKNCEDEDRPRSEVYIYFFKRILPYCFARRCSHPRAWIEVSDCETKAASGVRKS